MTYSQWRRARALSESKALRQLTRHGRSLWTPEGDLWSDWSHYARHQVTA